MDFSKIKSVRAVVIGISDYKDNELDLNYARSDAEAFCDYLRSSIGLPQDSIRIELLVDSSVTVPKIDNALQWLLKESRKGILAIFYFSGHGDVQKDIDRGFLLAYNTPQKADYLSSAFSMDFLRDYINAIVKKGAKALLIVDACRSGKLTRSTDGASNFTIALMQEWENTVKILSTQPNLLSYEYDKKKNGYFTYYLLRGLKGMANRDGNKTISLDEIEDYLEDTVKAEVGKTGYSQIPMVSGNKETILTNVDTLFLASLKNENIELSNEKRIATRGQLSPIASLDSVTKVLLYDFKISIKNGFLISAPDTIESAWEIYNQLKYRDDMVVTVTEMKSELINSLQNKTQTIINSYLRGKNEEANNIDLNLAYQEITIADSLIDENSMFYDEIKVKCMFMESLFYTEVEKRIKLLKECIAIQPDAAFSYCELGRAYYDAKNYDTAIINYEKAIELSPRWKYPYYNIGIVYYDLGQSDSAETYYKKAIEIDSDYADAYNNIGLIYYNKNDYSNSLEYYSKAVKINPNYQLAYYNLGLVYYGLTQMDKALENFNKCLEIDPDYKSALYSIGVVYYNLTQLDSALKYFSKATEIDTGYIDAYNYLGLIYNDKGDHSKAIEYFNKALEIDPNYKLAYYNLGLVYYSLTQMDKAIENFSKAIEIEPGYTDAYNYLGVIYFNEGDQSKAIEYYNKTIEIDPNYKWAYYNLGLVYTDLGETEKAILNYNKTIKLDSNYINAYDKVGILYFQIQDYNSAIKIYTKYLQFNPLDYYGYQVRGLCYFYDNNYIKSLADFQKVIELSPEYSGGYYNLACYYSVTNKTAESLANLEKAFQLGYDDFEHLEVDSDLDGIRSTPDFNKLIEKYKK